jgi:hypothetical protein
LYAKEALKTEDLRRCWRHMVATAVLAEAIAEACDMASSVAYTAGIMHDIGRLGLLMAFPKEYEQVASNAAKRSVDVLDFEQQEFGVHHAEAGRMLAGYWGLPEEFSIVTGRHHDPGDGGEVDLLRIVHLACRLADVFGYDFVRPLAPLDATAVLAELPAGARERIEKMAGELRERIEARIAEFDSDETSLPPRSSLDAMEPTMETSRAAAGVTCKNFVLTRPDVRSEYQTVARRKGFALALRAAVAILVVATVVFLWKLV